MRTKKELREFYKQKRAALLPEVCAEKSSLLANQLLHLPTIWQHSTYHLFLSIERLAEVDTQPILDILNSKNKRVAVPKMDAANRTLTSILLTDETLLSPNVWGIPEPEKGCEIPPEQVEVVFVPLLAYDRCGNRIGYGGGYYDRFLYICRPETLKIGLSFFPPEEDFSAMITSTDVSLNYVVTPEKIFEFN